MAVHKVTAKDDKAGDSPVAPSKKKAASKPTTTSATKATKASKAVKAPRVKRTVQPERNVPAILKPFVAIGRYFKGAWQELREVRWPTRKATWGLTIAVLIFTAFFMVIILLLDGVFKSLFELILQ